MVVAAIAGAAGILLGMVGLECVSAMEESKTKLWTGRCGGILLLLAGKKLCDSCWTLEWNKVHFDGVRVLCDENGSD